jgi:hypothetical protein
MVRIKDADAIKMVVRRFEGAKIKDLAEQYSTYPAMVSAICHGQTRRHILKTAKEVYFEKHGISAAVKWSKVVRLR